MTQRFIDIFRVDGILTYVEGNFSVEEYLAQYSQENGRQVLLYIYNHGFPDYSVDYLGEEGRELEEAEFEPVECDSHAGGSYKLEVLKNVIHENIKLSRFCGKMRDACLDKDHIERLKGKHTAACELFLFIAFNTNGIGSNRLPAQRGEFYDKTLAKDMYDIETIVDCFSGALFKNSRLIMIGISTGAFLTFSYSTNYTKKSTNIEQEQDPSPSDFFISNPNLIGIVCIACVDNIPESYCLDFDDHQLNEFNEFGFATVNTRQVPVVANTGENLTRADSQLKLISRDYLSSYNIFPTFNFLLKHKKTFNCPTLLIHGTDDKSVPFNMSLNLLRLNDESSKHLKLVEIEKGNHLLTSSKHMKKAQVEISRFVFEIV